MGILPGKVSVNIGLIIYGTIDRLTGGYLYDRRLVEYLKSNGHRVDIFPLPSRVYVLRLLDNFAQKYWERINGIDLDILLQDELCHPSLLIQTWQQSKRAGRSTIAIVHHLISDEPRPKMNNYFLRLIEKPYLQSVDGFIFNSQTTREKVFRLSRRPRPYVVASPGGDRFKIHISEDEVERRARRPGPLRLLYVGLVIPRKGLMELICALQRVPIDQWCLDIVGCLAMAPGYIRQINRFIHSHRLMSSIRFHGPINDEKLSDLFTTAQILCMPFAYEGFSIVAAEAAAIGLPVLGSKSGAMGKLVKHGVTGLLFSRNNLQAVAKAITDLYLNRHALARMSRSALRHSLNNPTWKQSLQQIEEFLIHVKNRSDTTTSIK
jgi:glycosyltransferase involved in cell wall biosynthesis